jgi:hypothetical protein
MSNIILFLRPNITNLKRTNMKKALLIIAVVVASLNVQAQSFRLGLSGGINSTWLMNKNVFDAGDELDIATTFGGRLGIDAIYSFNEKVGLSIGFNFISGHNQKYTGEDGFGGDYDAKVKLRYFDIPILFRLTSSGGTYFELGPQIGILTSAKEDFEASGFSDNDHDAKNAFNTTNIAAIIGFGVDIDVTDNLYITTGLRLGYGFTDATKEFDTPLEVTASDTFTAQITHYDDEGDFNYEKSSRVFGGLHLGLSYKFGGSK